MNEIVIKNLCKQYGEKKVLDNLSLTIPIGQKTAVMAPSGYGKTTLIRLIAGLEKPDSGEISGVPENISVVFQEDRLFEDFSVRTNIGFTKSKSADDRLVDLLLSSLGLSDWAAKPVRKLSGGMKRRVALARALAADFDLLILDEPFKGLDVKLKDDILEFLDGFCRDKSVILVTHDIYDAKKLNCKIIDIAALNCL